MTNKEKTTEMDILLNNARRGVELNAAEKAQIRSSIVAHMKRLPLGVKPVPALSYQESATLLGYQINVFRKLSFAVVAFLVVGIGSSFAAEGALPGDILYPMKVGLNEKVRASLTFAPYERANIQAKFAVRRLEEIEKLAQNGRLTAELRHDLESAFVARSDEAKKNINEIASSRQTTVAAEVSADLESAMASHERIIADLSVEVVPQVAVAGVRQGAPVQTKEPSRSELKSVLRIVREQRLLASEVRLNAEAAVTTQPETTLEDVKNSLVRAESSVKGVNKLLVHDGQAVSRDLKDKKVKNEARARIEVAGNVLEEGKTQLRAGKREEAFLLSQQARRMAKEVQTFVEADALINTDKNQEQKDNEREDDVEREAHDGDAVVTMATSSEVVIGVGSATSSAIEINTNDEAVIRGRVNSANSPLINLPSLPSAPLGF